LKHYIFYEGEPDSSYELDFEESLFNIYDHRLLQSKEGWVSFHVLNEKYKKTSASIHFIVVNDVARSPLRGPFGSIEFAETLPANVLFQFIEFVEDQLAKKNVKKIVIKNPPQLIHGNKAAIFYTSLFNLGYGVEDAEVGSVIQVNASPYHTLIDTWEKRRLRQADQGGLTLRELEISALGEVYDFIKKCRDEKGYKLSMSFAQLNEAALKFPSHYYLFGVYENNELAAASVAIRVKKNTLYNFYTAHNEKFDNLSPVVILIEGLYNYAAAKAIVFIDLGTSAIDGRPNFSLLNFKLNLGGEPTPKLTFAKNIP
jgi:hypothetical protein